MPGERCVPKVFEVGDNGDQGLTHMSIWNKNIFSFAVYFH